MIARALPAAQRWEPSMSMMTMICITGHISMADHLDIYPAGTADDPAG